jgi:hypothetical protein
LFELLLKYHYSPSLQDKFNVAEDYLSTDDEEEHAPGDARNELKRAGSNFDGVELKPYKTKVSTFQFKNI